MGTIDFTKITACGECCVGCKKKEEGLCEGCIESDGRCMEWAQSGECPVHRCAKNHGVQFCGLCDEFPCDDLPKKIHWKPNVVGHLADLAKAYHAEINIAPYFDWVQKVCAEKNIVLNGKITQITDAKLFCISSSVGDLYLKKTTAFINDEISFTQKLMELGIIDLPEWIGYDHDTKVCLMRDMGGSDLSMLPSLDMETSINMFVTLARIQKASVQFVNSVDFYGFNYRIDAMLEEMRELPESAYKMLTDTQYRLTREETEKLKRNTEYAGTVLKSINGLILPDTIHHGDLGTYNVRVVDGKSIFYDWGCGGVSHPFFDTFRLLSSIGGKLSTDVPAKEIIINAYLREWSDYGSHEELKQIFSAIDGLAGFYMMYCKYIRARNLHRLYAGNMEAANTDALGLNDRYKTAAIYLKRFIENDF